MRLISMLLLGLTACASSLATGPAPSIPPNEATMDDCPPERFTTLISDIWPGTPGETRPSSDAPQVTPEQAVQHRLAGETPSGFRPGRMFRVAGANAGFQWIVMKRDSATVATFELQEIAPGSWGVTRSSFCLDG